MADKKSFLLRIDENLWNRLQALASAEFRSVNGQIEYLLRQAVERREKPPKEGPPTPKNK